jgi:hypothetical protein
MSIIKQATRRRSNAGKCSRPVSGLGMFWAIGVHRSADPTATFLLEREKGTGFDDQLEMLLNM